MRIKNQITVFKLILILFVSIYCSAIGQVRVSVIGKRHLESLVKANNKFSFRLLQNLEKDKNIFFSPFSIHTALVMLNEGARGVTSQEIQNALSYDLMGVNSGDITRNFRDLLRLVKNVVGDEYQLEIANALVTQSNYLIYREYLNIIRYNFNGLVINVNFERESEEAAVKEINDWVGNVTRGKITTLLKELGEDTKAVILNAVYFKGSWEHPFNENLTENQIFYNDNINPVYTPTMRTEIQKCQYTRNAEEGFQAISLPYKGNHIEMIIILPLPKHSLQDIHLSAEKLEDIISRMREYKVHVNLPKFTLEYAGELKENLKILGMKQAFTRLANLSGINKDRRLFVKNVVHKAVIEVNERGSVATGSTGIVIGTRIGPIPFICDHPFLFIIRDKRTGMNLFMGQINQL